MGVSSNTNNPQQFDPTAMQQQSQSGTLSNTPSDLEVKPGAGGTFVVVTKDSLIPPGPSQTGLTGTQQGMGSTFAGAIQSDFPSLIAGTATKSFADLLSGILAPPTQNSMSDEFDTVSFYQPKSQTSSSQDSENSCTVSPEDAKLTLSQGFGSVDPEVVLKALLDSSGIDDNPMLSPEQKELLSGKLKKLADFIATENKNGEETPLKSFNPAVILGNLKDFLQIDKDPTLSDEEKRALSDGLSQAASELGCLNAASGSPPPKNELYTDMRSTSPDDVYTALSAFVSGTGGLTPDQFQEISPQLKALALQIAKQNPEGVPGLESPNPKTTLETLTTLLDVNNPLMPEGTKILLKAFINTTSAGIAATNKQVLTEMTFSTDPKVVSQALFALSDVKYNKNLSPSEVSATESYLNILAKALSFMSSIRATIAILEGEFRKSEAQGKLGNIQDQTRLSLVSFSKNMKEISVQLQDNLHEILKQKILKILFPFITLIMAIIAVVLIVVTLGAATPMAIALIAATVALATFALIDQTAGVIDKACKAGGIKDEAAKAAINLAVQASMAILVSIFTFGAGAVIFAEQLGVKMGASFGAKLGAAVKQIGVDEGVMMGMTLVTTVFSSGIVTAALTKLFKAAGMSDEMAAIMAMILTLLLMLVLLAGAVKLCGDEAGAMASKGGIKGAGETSQGVKSAEASLERAQASAVNASKSAKEADEALEAAAANKLKAIEAAEKADATDAVKAAKELAIKEADAAAEKAAKAAKDLKEADEALVAAQQELSTAKATDSVGVSQGKPADDAVGVNVSGGTSTAADDAASTATSSQISQMIQKNAKHFEEMFKDMDINELLRLTMILQTAAAAAEFSTTLAVNVQSIHLNEQQIALTRELTAAQAAIDELKTFAPFFDNNMDAVDQDAKQFVKFFSDILNLFAQMVASASNITSKLHQTS